MYCMDPNRGSNNYLIIIIVVCSLKCFGWSVMLEKLKLKIWLLFLTLFGLVVLVSGRLKRLPVFHMENGSWRLACSLHNFIVIGGCQRVTGLWTCPTGSFAQWMLVVLFTHLWVWWHLQQKEFMWYNQLHNANCWRLKQSLSLFWAGI